MRKIWVVEAHNMGALQVREAQDAIMLNRKRWMEARETPHDQAGKADRMLVGIGETIDEALEVERELKRMRGEKKSDGSGESDGSSNAEIRWRNTSNVRNQGLATRKGTNEK